MAWVFLLAGLALLTLGGDLLVRGSVTLAVRLKVSALVIGMTVVSFATSCPELLVSLNAAFKGHTDITFGNVIGSNIANIGLVLGLTAAIFGLSASVNSRRFDWPAMFLSSILFMLFVYFDGYLGFVEGLVFFVLLVAFNIFLISASRRDESRRIHDLPEEDKEDIPDPPGRMALYLVVGAVALFYGSDWLIQGAVDIARAWDVSERVISVSMVSVGTSIPELAASLIATFKKEQSLSIGNLIGSNIFNILAVLGITAMIHPIHITDHRLLEVDIWWMLGIAFLLAPFLYVGKKRTIGNWQGFILLATYGIYVYLLFTP